MLPHQGSPSFLLHPEQAGCPVRLTLGAWPGRSPSLPHPDLSPPGPPLGAQNPVGLQHKLPLPRLARHWRDHSPPGPRTARVLSPHLCAPSLPPACPSLCPHGPGRQPRLRSVCSQGTWSPSGGRHGGGGGCASGGRFRVSVGWRRGPLSLPCPAGDRTAQGPTSWREPTRLPGQTPDSPPPPGTGPALAPPLQGAGAGLTSQPSAHD